MKAAEITNNGYYWCSHDTGMHMPAGETYPAEWHVVLISGGWLSMAGADVELPLGQLPDYVHFVGPLEAPEALAISSAKAEALQRAEEQEGRIRCCRNHRTPVFTRMWNCPQCFRPLPANPDGFSEIAHT